MAFLCSSIASDYQRPTLIICPSAFHAINLQENLSAWTSSNILRFPEVENLPYERIISNKETSMSRIETITKITNSNHFDVLEMDAASKTGVDAVRDLIEFSR